MLGGGCEEVGAMVEEVWAIVSGAWKVRCVDCPEVCACGQVWQEQGGGDMGAACVGSVWKGAGWTF